MSYSYGLPSGDEVNMRVDYTMREVNGVRVLIVASCLSMTATCGLLIAIALSAYNTRKSTNKSMFVRTHVAAYFISLLLCDLMQAVGSIMNEKWVQNKAVYLGNFCTTQGIFKQAADIGIAMFALIIAIHTFCVLFLRWQSRPYVLWLTLVSAWSAMGAIVLAGPTLADTTKYGPFFGISGYWCWITAPYPVQHITLDYMFMFMSAGFSFLLYTLVFLRLRGNIIISGWYIAFRRATSSSNSYWRGREFADNEKMVIARQMMLYPVAYVIVILPIATARFCEMRGNTNVPFGATIFCDTVYLLSGLVNVTLFVTTRRVLPPQSIIPRGLAISHPRLVQTTQSDPEDFYQAPRERKLGSRFSDSGSVLSVPTEHGEPPVRHK